MQRWRGSRWWSLTAVLFGLLVPGLGGSVLAVLHPCPVGTPWMATTASADAATSASDAHDAHAHHAAAEAPAPESSSHQHADGASCSCVGACSMSGVTAIVASLPPFIDAPVLAGVDRPGFTVVAARLSARLRDLLPPSTAPPAIA